MQPVNYQHVFREIEIHSQLDRGGEAVFEHPWGSWAWNMPEMIDLRRRMILCRTDLCAFGLTDIHANVALPRRAGTRTHAQFVQPRRAGARAHA